ncbi:hypothetical protein [Rhodococcus sp. 06-235-1A]|uniref:hypothetical protein n=1 Tax=Rhodococcus sp. 06-235-1A TaxID=2022508 RepID=UPI00117A5A58|nr:hypothetical protein [Rhodococcus sp. 06-235-1A]
MSGATATVSVESRTAALCRRDQEEMFETKSQQWKTRVIGAVVGLILVGTVVQAKTGYGFFLGPLN